MSIEALSCPGVLSPVCQTVGGVAGGVGSSIVGSAAGDVLSSLSSWVVQGASWLLGQVGGLLKTTTSIDLSAKWFATHYQVMVSLAGVVLLPLLLASVIQAVYRQNASVLVRTALVQLPLALLLTAVAVQLVQLALSVTDALSSSVASGAGGDIDRVLSGVANAFASQGGGGPMGPGAVPAFVMVLGALLVTAGSFTLWIELLVRSAAVYVAVLFLPLALASLVWPAIAHWCRRLVDTLVALVLSKFVIVAVLSLGASALASGARSGFASVLGGGAMLLLATFVPFALLRMVPVVEAGAIYQLEGARHRATAAASAVPRSAAAFALRAERTTRFDPGLPGTGQAGHFEAPGGAHGGGPRTGVGAGEGIAGRGPGRTGRARPARSGPGAGPSPGGAPQGLPEWAGNPATDEAFRTMLAGSGPLDEHEAAAAGLPVGWSGAAPDDAPATDGADQGPGSGFPLTRPAPGPPGRGQLVLVKDRIGPRIRWIPPGASWAHELLGPEAGEAGPGGPEGGVGG